MILTVFHGLPTHVLLVHFVVVLGLLTALTLVVCAVWPEAGRRLGPVLPLLALVTMALVPFTTNAGEWLRDRIGDIPLVNQHRDLADEVLPWVVSMLAVSVAAWWVTLREAAGERGWDVKGARYLWPALRVRPRTLRVIVAVAAVAAAAGSATAIYRAGDSGAKAAWQGVVQSGGPGGGGGAGKGGGPEARQAPPGAVPAPPPGR
ncbi:DUF2231 domain-containing protein [Streptomyces sp. TS71-3]|uniref:DUF2231 domain-containing protein n=1 Tax=Streptomyces sp. TS71-3 TaxID=2733862 RepID=UPI001B2D795A|nr:DUF2231 domain-containing protein [Streptomyces sp. TS71-3]GHJ38105.1 hypothetical protein Sm713_37140 [Streptomyces sp. TS71-3]